MIVLVIPVVAVLLALVWVRWVRQPDKPLDPAAAVEAHRRALEALAPNVIVIPDRAAQRSPSRMPTLR